MAIKPLNAANVPVVSAPPDDRMLPTARVVSYAPSSSSYDKIIDCVEIQSHHFQPALPRPAAYPNRSDGSVENRGTLIDLWI